MSRLPPDCYLLWSFVQRCAYLPLSPSVSLSLSLPLPPSLLSSQTSVFPQGDVWICMELMDKSLHQLYKLVYETLHLSIPEPVVGKMAEAVSR